jgi:nicotinamidase-related amidase
MEKSLLLIVDMQEGLLKSDATKAVVPKIKQLEKVWHERSWPVAFSKYINKPESPWVRFIGSDSSMSAPETDLATSFEPEQATVYEKTTYSAWSPEISQLCYAANVQSVVLCGVDTDQCVLATAIAAFDSGIKPIIIKDCCASDAGSQFHDAALLLVERLIGRDQMKTSAEVL